ncbi:MAG: amidase, partial [Acidobacteria bacterium]|nr:amidase [Acidobacteriota bacterium]
MMDGDICFARAVDVARLIRERRVSAVEVMQAHLEQIDRVNPKVNAIVTLVPEAALAEARRLDDRLARGEPVGVLAGLPVAHKDLTFTRGIRTTLGSTVFRDFVPSEDALIVERLKAAGAITVGKTNTPEFGAGSQTFNEVFGATLNPWDLSKTCGGSSGGAAVALSCGLVPIADGSDMGGSLRNPANFCSVVGFRPSPGRVPVWPKESGWDVLGVQGPMARTVEDTALLLSAIAGPDERSPIALAEPGEIFALPLERELAGTRVAWSPDLGTLPVDSKVREVLEGQRGTFETLGCVVEDGLPDLSAADQVFRTLRALSFATKLGDLYKEHRAELKDTVRWNIEAGLRLTGEDLRGAELARTELYHQMREFMRDVEFLILPVSQVPPFDVTEEWVKEVDGVVMETYIDWMKSC